MGSYYISIVIVVLSNILYHVFQKSIPQQFNPFVSLIVTYITAIVFSLVLLPFCNSNFSISEHLKYSFWPSIALGFAIVGLEVGFLLAYRSGWDISIASVLSNISVAIFLIPVGLLIYKESFSKINFVGIIFCVVGLILVRK